MYFPPYQHPERLVKSGDTFESVYNKIMKENLNWNEK